MKQHLHTFLVKNWKTSIAGLAMAMIAYLKAKGHIGIDETVLGGSIVSTVGLLLSKDGNVSGQSDPEAPVE